MSSISKNISITFGTKIISTILALGSSVFLTRMLGKEGNGAYGFIMANVNLFAVLLGFGMARTMTYFIAKEDSDVESVSGLGFYISAIGIAVFSLFTFALYYSESDLINFLLPKGYVSAFIICFMIGNFIHKTATNYLIGVWQGTLKFNSMNLALLQGNAIRLIALAGVWFYVNYSKTDISIVKILYILLIILSVDLLVRFAIFFKGKNKLNFSVNLNGTLCRSILVFGSIGIATRVLNFANKRLDIWFVEAYNGLEELGIYLLAVGLVDIMIATIVPGVQVLIPYYTQRNPAQRMQLLSKVSRINLLFTSILITTVVLLSIYVIPFLYGEEFRESVHPFILLCFGAFFLLIRNVFASFNVATNHQKINLRANILALVITLILDITLIPKYGIIGACYASIVAYAASCMFVIIITLRNSELSISKFIFINRNDVSFLYDFIVKKVLTRFK